MIASPNPRILFQTRYAVQQPPYRHGRWRTQNTSVLPPGGIQEVGEPAAYRAVKRRITKATVKIGAISKLPDRRQRVVDQLALWALVAFHPFTLFGKDIDPSCALR